MKVLSDSNKCTILLFMRLLFYVARKCFGAIVSKSSGSWHQNFPEDCEIITPKRSGPTLRTRGINYTVVHLLVLISFNGRNKLKLCNDAFFVRPWPHSSQWVPLLECNACQLTRAVWMYGLYSGVNIDSGCVFLHICKRCSRKEWLITCWIILGNNSL